MDLLPDNFALINAGDSPTQGQHGIFPQPQGNGHLHADVAGVASWSKYPEWAWQLLQYVVGHTKDDLWMGPTGMASVALTGFPKQALKDSMVHRLWARVFGGDSGIDTFFNVLDGSVSVPRVLPASREDWYPQWTDFVVARLQDCLPGKTTADQACDAVEAEAKKLRGR